MDNRLGVPGMLHRIRSASGVHSLIASGLYEGESIYRQALLQYPRGLGRLSVLNSRMPSHVWILPHRPVLLDPTDNVAPRSPKLDGKFHDSRPTSLAVLLTLTITCKSGLTVWILLQLHKELAAGNHRLDVQSWSPHARSAAAPILHLNAKLILFL